ncbi:MAG: hypothetical protein LBD72_00705 [Puniceicoccales bacterium]|jgi:hypothetical protein|nr:hypothetical protein [Puniceicoccales bacterium]
MESSIALKLRIDTASEYVYNYCGFSENWPGVPAVLLAAETGNLRFTLGLTPEGAHAVRGIRHVFGNNLATRGAYAVVVLVEYDDKTRFAGVEFIIRSACDDVRPNIMEQVGSQGNTIAYGIKRSNFPIPWKYSVNGNVFRIMGIGSFCYASIVQFFGDLSMMEFYVHKDVHQNLIYIAKMFVTLADLPGEFFGDRELYRAAGMYFHALANEKFQTEGDYCHFPPLHQTQQILSWQDKFRQIFSRAAPCLASAPGLPGVEFACYDPDVSAGYGDILERLRDGCAHVRIRVLACGRLDLGSDRSIRALVHIFLQFFVPNRDVASLSASIECNDDLNNYMTLYLLLYAMSDVVVPAERIPLCIRDGYAWFAIDGGVPPRPWDISRSHLEAGVVCIDYIGGFNPRSIWLVARIPFDRIMGVWMDDRVYPCLQDICPILELYWQFRNADVVRNANGVGDFYSSTTAWSFFAKLLLVSPMRVQAKRLDPGILWWDLRERPGDIPRDVDVVSHKLVTPRNVIVEHCYCSIAFYIQFNGLRLKAVLLRYLLPFPAHPGYVVNDLPNDSAEFVSRLSLAGFAQLSEDLRSRMVREGGRVSVTCEVPARPRFMPCEAEFSSILQAHYLLPPSITLMLSFRVGLIRLLLVAPPRQGPDLYEMPGSHVAA